MFVCCQLNARQVSDRLSLWAVLRSDLVGVDATIAALKQQHSVARVILAGHSMSAGGILAQDYAHASALSAHKSSSISFSSSELSTNGVNATHAVDALVLLSAFLQRRYRPDLAACVPKAALQPAFRHVGVMRVNTCTCVALKIFL